MGSGAGGIRRCSLLTPQARLVKEKFPHVWVLRLSLPMINALTVPILDSGSLLHSPSDEYECSAVVAGAHLVLTPSKLR